MNTLDKNVLFSGGASGADSYFSQFAQKRGDLIVHWGFPGMDSEIPRKHIIELNQEQLKEADSYLTIANSFLKRKFPTKSGYVNSLLRRNYYQIAYTKSIYAISSIDSKGIVEGGTSWAVMMGITRKVDPIYVFDQNRNKWYEFVCMIDQDCHWAEALVVPSPKGFYTGIGSRSLSDFGKLAIEGLYV
jgi:hypothetical protein